MLEQNSGFERRSQNLDLTDNCLVFSENLNFMHLVKKNQFIIIFLGRPTEENLRDLMMQSRRTMVLVSKNYLNSIYFTEELEMALTFQGGSRLLLIALDISALKQFMFTHPLLENFVQTHSYLDFDNGSPRFYKELLKTLPKNKCGAA